MKVTILVVGKASSEFAGPILEFETRAARYWKLQVVEVAAGIGRGGVGDPAQVMAAEGERLLKRIPEGVELWALHRDGRQTSSEAFSQSLGTAALDGNRDQAFAIGGAFGLSKSVLDRSLRRLSLSEMTLPHELARLVLAEQLYRAGTILRNEPYHKGRS